MGNNIVLVACGETKREKMRAFSQYRRYHENEIVVLGGDIRRTTRFGPEKPCELVLLVRSRTEKEIWLRRGGISFEDYARSLPLEQARRVCLREKRRLLNSLRLSGEYVSSLESSELKRLDLELSRVREEMRWEEMRKFQEERRRRLDAMNRFGGKGI